MKAALLFASTVLCASPVAAQTVTSPGPDSDAIAQQAAATATASVQGAISTLRAQIPVPLATAPPGATPTGAPGTAGTYTPGNAVPPSLVRRKTVVTASDCTFSVSWQTPLTATSGWWVNAVSNTPSNSSQPAICNPLAGSVTASGFSGVCRTLATSTLSLTLVSSGITINPSSGACSGLTVNVSEAEPTP